MEAPKNTVARVRRTACRLRPVGLGTPYVSKTGTTLRILGLSLRPVVLPGSVPTSWYAPYGSCAARNKLPDWATAREAQRAPRVEGAGLPEGASPTSCVWLAAINEKAERFDWAWARQNKGLTLTSGIVSHGPLLGAASLTRPQQCQGVHFCSRQAR